MAVYGPVRHQKNSIWTEACPYNIFLVQLYVGGPMSYLRYLCFLFCLSCVPNVTSFFLDCRFVLPFQCALTFIGQRILVI
jgi:hypothetical protein